MTRDPIAHSLDAAARSQQVLNAFTHLEDAENLDPASAGPLAGRPIALKDLLDQADRVTTAGSAFYRRHADVSATAVSRLEEAGGTIIGRTGLHEFAFGFSSENPHFGPVRNPWDPTTSPGGSSGGSGAAVGAGIVPIAIGTDTGGSVRVPAALCGCFGLKVTHGAIPTDGVFPLVPSIDTVGPLTGSVDDLEAAYRAMSHDTTRARLPDRLRFGIPQPWTGNAPMDTHVESGFRAALDRLEESGHEVHVIDLPDVMPDRNLIFAIAREIQDVHRDFREAGETYGEEVGRRLDDIFTVTDEEMSAGRAWQEMVRSRFDDAFATVDFLLTPTVPTMRKTIGVETIGGTHYRKVLSWFTAIVNHALCPAVAAPLAGTGSPPVSLQVIGPLRSEAALIALTRDLVDSGVCGFRPAGPLGATGPTSPQGE